MVVRANERYDRAMLDLQSRPKCSECPIRHRAVCARCDDDELLMLEQIKTYRSFKAGDPMLWRGDGLTYVASVVSGVASLGKTMEDGRTQMVGLLFPSDFIGRPGRAAIDFDVVAVTDVTLCCFQRKPFEALIETTPHIAQRLMEMALDELTRRVTGCCCWAVKPRAKRSRPSLRCWRGGSNWPMRIPLGKSWSCLSHGTRSPTIWDLRLKRSAASSAR